MSAGDAELLHDAGGGRMILRVGGSVHRPSYPFSKSVHGLLGFLQDVGFDGAPHFEGIDDSGAEILSYIDADAGAAGWEKVLSDDGLRSIARLLRRYDETIRQYAPPEDCEWSSGARGGGCEGDVVLHGSGAMERGVA